MQAVLIILAFNLIVYFKALRCTIIIDDVRWYKRWQDIIKKDGRMPRMTWSSIPQRLYGGGTFGINPINDHLFGLILHIISCLLIYAVLGHNAISFWTSILWASSSTTMHTAVWLNGRRYSVNIILTLLMMACVNAGAHWLPLFALLYVFTPQFHMTAFFAPILAIKLSLLPIISILFLFSLFKKRIIDHINKRMKLIPSTHKREYSLNRLIVVVKCYGWYFFKMIFPGHTRMIYGTLYFWGETPEGNKNAYSLNVDFIKGISAVALSAVLICVLPMEYKYLCAFMVLSTAQWCALIASTQTLADRYICLPSIFMKFFLTLGVYHLFPDQSMAILVGICAYNLALLQMSFPMFKNILGMYDYLFYYQPNVVAINREYINWMIRSGDFIKAFTLTKECLKYNPTDIALLHAAALCSKMAGDKISARKYVDIAERHLYFGQEDIQRKWISDFRKGL